MPWFDLFVKAAGPSALDRARKLAAAQRDAEDAKRRRKSLESKAPERQQAIGSNPDTSIARRPIGVRTIGEYPVAYGYLESGPGSQPIYAYSGNGLAYIRKDIVLPEVPEATQYIETTTNESGVSYTTYAKVTQTFAALSSGGVIFPAGGENLITAVQVNHFMQSVAYWSDGPEPIINRAFKGSTFGEVTHTFYEHCFVVSRDAVREINTPTAVSQIMRRQQPGDPEWVSALFSDVYPGPDLGAYPFNVVVLEQDPPEAYPATGRSLDSYGMQFNAADISVTAGIFTSYIDGRNDLEDISSYTEAASILLAASAPIPSVYLESCRLEGTCSGDGGTLNADVSQIVPTSILDTDGLPFEANRAPALTTTRPDTHDPFSFVNSIAVWDWGNPEYCKQKLLALGFSESDLQP